jgi:hypothetical protein
MSSLLGPAGNYHPVLAENCQEIGPEGAVLCRNFAIFPVNCRETGNYRAENSSQLTVRTAKECSKAVRGSQPLSTFSS